jgi:hypothetical protein
MVPISALPLENDMKTVLATLSCLLLICAAALAPAAPCPLATEPLVSAVDVTTWPPAPYRWRDIGTNLYAQSYQDTYLYDDAVVTVAYHPCAGLNFTGHVSAANLKPNFAYQIKLVGKPTGLWGEDGDDAANEMLGMTGRWWRTQPNAGNSNDADYLANHDNPDYIFEGYLLVDFFVTAPDGTAEVDFLVDSSYHVLWWEHQRTPGVCDSPVKWSTISGSAADPAYPADITEATIGVYAEIERLCTGQTSLPLGTYHARLILTEESFHQSGDTEGYWASAMAFDDLQFEVVDSLAEVPNAAAPAALGNCYPNPFNPTTTIPYRLQRPATVELEILDLDGARVRSLVAGVHTTSGDHAAVWRGNNDAGRAVAAGVYVVRLKTDGIVQTETVTLIK